jgi:hypothetical protein
MFSRFDMFSRIGCVAAICLGLFASAEAAEQRADCATVRYYVAKYSISTAEMWARSQGMSEAEIAAARSCLRRTPAHSLQAARWKAVQ